MFDPRPTQEKVAGCGEQRAQSRNRARLGTGIREDGFAKMDRPEAQRQDLAESMFGKNLASALGYHHTIFLAKFYDATFQC